MNYSIHSISARPKKRHEELEALRKKNAEDLAKKIKTLQKEYSKYFGKIAPFNISKSILKVLESKKFLLDDLEEDFRSFIRKMSGSEKLTEYDRLNLAMVFVKVLSDKHPKHWENINKVVEENELDKFGVNRTVVAWLRDNLDL